MHIAISGCTSDETFLKTNQFANELQPILNRIFEGDDYGSIKRLLIVIVAVETENEENFKFCKNYNKSGTYTHPFTKERVKYLSIAVPYNPADILRLDSVTLKKNLVAAIIENIRNPTTRIPKGMAFDAFTEKAVTALQIYAAADS